jgi:tetratricopeptide (TPR) repeat protein
MLMTDDPWEKCLGIIAYGADQAKRGDPGAAQRALVAAMLATRTMTPEAGNDIRALALYNLSRLRSKQGREQDARQIREHAAAALAQNAAPSPDALFQTLMAEVLMELGEYRRAISFCERSLQLAVDWKSPFLLVEVLWRAGKCYAKNGLRDHAAVPLGEVVKILRTQPDDPRLPAAVIDLGNALRKSSPAEAEKCYQEAARWHVSRAQFESATPAWVNLGVLYSETRTVALHSAAPDGGAA